VAIDPASAFVSYSRDDLEFVLCLAGDLKAKGAKVWMDKLDILPGKSWADEIQAAVAQCSRMLIVMSPTSVASRNVQAEVGYAISEGKEVIPIFYRDCTIPFRLLPYQYADFRTDYSAGLQELLSGLNGERDSQSRNRVEPITSYEPPLNQEERRRQSALVHAELAERHKQLSAEQARLELEERKLAEAADNARRELERQRVVDAEARLEEDQQQKTAEQACLLHEAADREAAEDKARQEEQERVRVVGEQEGREAQRERTATAAAQQERKNRKRAARAQRALQYRRFVACLADRARKLKRHLPQHDFHVIREMLVAGVLCVVMMAASGEYERVVASRLKYGHSFTPIAESQIAITKETNPERVSSTQSHPPALISPAAKSPDQQPTMKTQLRVFREVPRKSTSRTQVRASASPPNTPPDASPSGINTKAADSYREAANAGNSQAMNNLGDLYKDGLRGVNQDYGQAANWYRKAAIAGNARGMSNLGRMYDNGWGLPTDYKQAVAWYRRAAEAGDLQGMTSLGVMYEDGLGVPKDFRQAFTWYQKAADAGDTTGMCYMADMYEYGKGQKQDLEHAFYWYRRAAEAGDAGAMNKVAGMYETGKGLHKDQSQAVAWYRKAAQIGNQNAKNNLKRLGSSAR